jgi:hypothetical protein
MRKQISSVVVMSVFLIVLDTAVFFGSGCTSSQSTPQTAAEVEVTDAPPAPIVEDVPRSPGEGYVWISGA